jgi:hypothetical protein
LGLHLLRTRASYSVRVKARDQLLAISFNENIINSKDCNVVPGDVFNLRGMEIVKVCRKYLD